MNLSQLPTPNARDLYGFIASGVALVIGFAAIAKVWSMVKAQFATHEAFELLRQDCEAMKERVRTLETNTAAAAEARAIKLLKELERLTKVIEGEKGHYHG